ncbi:L-2-amino-thiazoline-4-carboxylic acid hydrolase [Bacteroidota bacterium]
MKEDDTNKKMQRRKFIGGLATACALPCLGMQTLFAMSKDAENLLHQDPQEEPKHKFGNPYPKEFSFEQVFDMRFGEFISMAKDLEDEIGKEKLIEFLKKRTEKSMFEYGKSQAEKAEDNSLKNYVAQFKDPYYDNTLTKEIVEESDTVFELKVTECLWAKTFLKRNAGNIGFAAICHGDYSWPKGYNPKIKMVRDKTLMQGNEYCNHRYIIES